MKLITGSCVLRPPTALDADALAKHANNRNVWINLRDGFPHPYTLEDARDYIDRIRDQDPRSSFLIAVGDEPCGSISLMPRADVERISAELGYWLAEPYWGRGIATDAVNAICEYGFAHVGLRRIFATVMAHNPASFRVLEKAGFEREGLMRNACIKDGRVTDMVLYARTG